MTQHSAKNHSYKWLLPLLVCLLCWGTADRAEAGFYLGLRAGTGIGGGGAAANLETGQAQLNPSPVFGDFDVSMMFDTNSWNRSGLELDFQVGNLNIVGIYASSMVDFIPGRATFGLLAKAGPEFILGARASFGLGVQAGITGGYQFVLSRNVLFEVGGDISYRLGLILGTTSFIGHSIMVRTYGIFRFGSTGPDYIERRTS